MTGPDLGIKMLCVRVFMQLISPPHDSKGESTAFVSQTQIKVVTLCGYLRLGTIYVAHVEAKKNPIQVIKSSQRLARWH